jgi:hypothetical protein
VGQIANGGGSRSEADFLAATVAPVPVAPIVLPCLFAFIGWSVTVSGRQRAGLLATLRSFSVRSAKVALEADRVKVEHAISSWYQSDDPHEGVRAVSSSAAAGTTGALQRTPAEVNEGLQRFEEQLHSGRVYHSVQQLVGRHRCGMSILDRLFVVIPVILTGIDYALDNPPDSSMAWTFIFIMAPFFMLAMHVLSMVLPPLFVLLRRFNCDGTLAHAILLPLGGFIGMTLLQGLFSVALEPQCKRWGTFL